MNGVDATTLILACSMVLLLGAATLIGHSLAWQRASGLDPAVLNNFNNRLRTWWLITSFVAASFLLPRAITIFFFGALSFTALREYITVAPTRRADHRALFWAFFLFTPLQYLLVWLENYGLYSVLIPIYACLFLPTRIAMTGDPKRFLERAAVIQTGLMVCVYCLSFAPALLSLRIDPDAGRAARVNTRSAATEGVRGSELSSKPKEIVPLEEEHPLATARPRDRTANYQLLVFLLACVIAAEISQFVVSKLFLGEAVASEISPGRTYEGMLGGMAITTLLGASLHVATPLQFWQASGLALVIALMAYSGGMTMSAIKRDKRVSDYGALVDGHGGVLDRIDSLCFAAPVFFHLTRFLLASNSL